MALEAEVQKLLSITDQKLLASSGNSSWARNSVRNRLYDDVRARNSALAELWEEAGSIKFADDGMIANWESCDA